MEDQDLFGLSISQKVPLRSSLLTAPSRLWKIIILLFSKGTRQSVARFQPSADYLVQTIHKQSC